MTLRQHEARAKRAFVEHTALDPVTRQRLQARLSRPRSPLRWGLAAVAAAALILAGMLLRSPANQPITQVPEHVQVRFDGEGAIGGTAEAPELNWQEGIAHIEVEPNQGVTFTVNTGEARVRVIGTAFDVARTHVATEVTVEHGRVGVTCTGEPELFLTDGQRARCLPNDLPSLLQRITALTVAGAAPFVRLESIDRADRLVGDAPSARGELLAHRIQALQDAARRDDALAMAHAYIDEGHLARRPELLSYIAHQRFEQDRCAALPALERAVAELPPGPEGLLLASCLQHTDPVRARRLVDAAAPVVHGAWESLARQLRAALPEVPHP